VVVLRDGAIEQVGSPLELYDRPANQFVAQFIGTPQMNVVATLTLPPLRLLAGARVPEDGFVGMRPEAVRVRPGGGGALKGKVELVEALGADTLIYVDVGGVQLVSRQAERTAARAGDEVGLDVDAAVLHFFDKQGHALRTSA